ncbi:MAG: cbb3-type cytochrome c oxidase subunit I [Microthrixaceae bacterium]
MALFLLMFDRLFGSNFFDAANGGDPMLWQHLFWIFGHPEVYIMILPSFGIVSEIIPVFSRKPLFGYPFMVVSGIAIGFMGWGVWAHHMFASGMGPMSVMAFSLSTMFIAVPTGVKILNWLATMYGGRLKFATPMLFSVGLVSMFTIGGLSGVTHAFAPADTQQTDTYYIVAHFHYVLFGGALLGLFGGFYFWWPKIFGYFLNERWGKVHFWVTLIGFNLTFGPMHVLGLQGMSRRYFTYSADQGFSFWNMVASVGAFTIAVGLLVFMSNVWKSHKAFKKEPVRGARRSVGRPQPRVDDPVAGPGVQLRRDPRDPRTRRLLAPQVRPRRGRPAGPHRQDRGHRPEAGRHGHPPAVTVVLADRPVRRSAVHRLRHHLRLLVGGPRVPDHRSPASSAGSSNRRPTPRTITPITAPTTTTVPTSSRRAMSSRRWSGAVTGDAADAPAAEASDPE